MGGAHTLEAGWASALQSNGPRSSVKYKVKFQKPVSKDQHQSDFGPKHVGRPEAWPSPSYTPAHTPARPSPSYPTSWEINPAIRLSETLA